MVFFRRGPRRIEDNVGEFGPTSSQDRIDGPGSICGHTTKCQVYVTMGQYQVCYVPRGDLNLDVNIFKMIFAEDGTVEARQYIQDPETVVTCCRLVQELYCCEKEEFQVCYEDHSAFLSYKQIKYMIRNETIKLLPWMSRTTGLEHSIRKAVAKAAAAAAKSLNATEELFTPG